MAFEYNGVVYRDLEPQVRYDAEQVQLLKQADVTINENLQTVNENLQTINTEIDGKLTKPANPSAESAVTMTADGTVGTKPLSEIGGSGGGKLYRHNITIFYNNQLGIITSSIYNTSDSLIENIGGLGDYKSPWSYNSYQASGSVFVEFHAQNATFDVKGVVCKRNDKTVYVVLEEGMTVNQFSDIVIEV